MLGHYGLPYAHYYGKREAEPEPKADADPYLLYGYGYPYGKKTLNLTLLYFHDICVYFQLTTHTPTLMEPGPMPTTTMESNSTPGDVQ